MSETYQFNLPFLQSAQAQKHVTVNEALSRIDVLSTLRAVSRTLDEPAIAADGQLYIVPQAATGAWLGQDGLIAVYLNGAWEFVTPKEGWFAWVIDEAIELRFRAGTWQFLQSNLDPNAAQIENATFEFDHTIVGGSSVEFTTGVLPANSIISAVSVRVISALSGITSFKVGVDGTNTRYGGEVGVALNHASYKAVLAKTYTVDTPLRLASTGGDFVDGALRFGVHYLKITPPIAV